MNPNDSLFYFLKDLGIDYTLESEFSVSNQKSETKELSNIQESYNNIQSSVSDERKSNTPTPTYSKDSINAIKQRYSNLQQKQIYADYGPSRDSKEQKIKEILLNVKDLDGLKLAIDQHCNCNLKDNAISTVYGDGNPKANLVVMGEAPGSEEDKNGVPFVGRSGQLLMKALESLDFNRTNAYILNSVFWRPPANDKPTKEQLAICRPFLMKALEIIQPDYILAVGAVASHNLLQSKTPIGKLRGRFHEFTEGQFSAKLLPTYHPAYCIRDPRQKEYLWLDILLLRSLINKI